MANASVEKKVAELVRLLVSKSGCEKASLSDNLLDDWKGEKLGFGWVQVLVHSKDEWRGGAWEVDLARVKG